MNKKYNVNNYHNFISLPTEDDKRPLSLEEGNLNELKPFSKMLTLEQIEYISKMTDLFSTGRVEFDKDDEDELFQYLGIDNVSECFRARDIIDIIKNPTKEKLERIISINNLNTIDLFRGIVVSFRNLNSEDVSNRVMTIINKRRDEIYKSPSTESTIVVKKTNTEIESEKRANENAKIMEEIKIKENDFKIKEENYKNELKEMKEKIKKMEDELKKSKKDSTKKKESSKKENK